MSSITQSITAFDGKTPPSLADPDNFPARADAFNGAFPTFQTQINTLSGQINTVSSEVQDNADTASEAAFSATIIASYKGDWSSGTTYALGESVSRNNYYFRSKSSGNINHDPSTDTSFIYWLPVNSMSNGIKFSNIASTDSSTLDWYEEGTFIPTIIGATTAGDATYIVQKGSYQRIGNVVNFRLIVRCTSHTGTGNAIISGLPFTSTSNGLFSSCTIGYINYFTWTSGNTLGAYIASGVNFINLFQFSPSGSNPTGLVINATSMYVTVSGSYGV